MFVPRVFVSRFTRIAGPERGRGMKSNFIVTICANNMHKNSIIIWKKIRRSRCSANRVLVEYYNIIRHVDFICAVRNDFNFTFITKENKNNI